MPSAPTQPGADEREPAGPLRIALIGMPNTGKTTLFNRLTGLRHKTSNFPGTTLEARVGFVRAGEGVPEGGLRVIDLPGVYSLELEQLESGIVREVLAGRLTLAGQPLHEPDGVVVVLDATNLSRNLVLAGEALRRRLPTVVAVNMIDLASRQGLHVDAARLSEALGCPVVLINARRGEGAGALLAQAADHAARGIVPTRTPPGGATVHEQAVSLRAWADGVFAGCCSAAGGHGGEVHRVSKTDRADRVLTHPALGVLVFAVAMAGLFFSIFTVAQYPMDWIDAIFTHLGAGVDAVWRWAGWTPGLVHDLLKDGVIAGIGATVVFVPQIALLFFLVSLLEDTGYLARAALVMDRALRPFGLPGHAFVPLLSAHACALPGIMATRCIPDPKERLATILVAPFMTCSARLPVYVLLTGILFPDQPTLAALAFVGCYALGISAGALSALVARRTVLRGPARPMALELPSYKVPSLRTAFITTYDRARTFLKKAGTMILAASIVLWWLGAFPRVEPPDEARSLRATAAEVRAGRTRVSDAGDPKAAARWAAMSEPERREAQAGAIDRLADATEARHARRSSFIGLAGRALAPALAPIGADWQLTIGVLASFAAREVFVSTMRVVVTGQDAGDDDPGVRAQLTGARRDDGTRLFSPAAAWSLLVFYVLAMQCMATLILTARETGHPKWALLQLAWMSTLAFGASTIVYQALRGAGLAS